MRAGIGKRVAWSVGGMVAVLLTVYLTSSRWPVPTAQREALAQLQRPPAPLRGPNLFAALWALPYAVPAAQQQAVLEEDVSRFRQRPAGAAFHSVAGRYRRIPDWPSASVPRCGWNDDDCLDKVRMRRQDYAAALATQAPLLAAMPVPQGPADYRSPFPPSPDLPLPEFALLRTPLAHHALDFVDGRVDLALTGVCNDAGVARILLRSDDNLITSLIGAAMLRGNARLFAAMLAELPPQHALPAQCAQAFTPLQADEVSLCGPLRGEARWAFSAFDELASDRRAVPQRWYDAVLVRLAFDAERSKAAVAPRYTRACAADVRAALAEDRLPTAAQLSVPDAPSMACVANMVGCAVASISPPEFARYQASLQDTAATMRLLSALLWLREHSAAPPQQRLNGLPGALRGRQRPIQATADGQSVQVALYAGNEGDILRLPLPGSRLRR